MSFFTFPYRNKRIALGQIVEPLIQIHIKSSYGWQSVWMLVDTGADTTSLPLKLAQRLGINYDFSRKESLYGIGNDIIYGYPTKIGLKINGFEFNVRTHLLDSNQHMLLLGRMDIFDLFTLIFDNNKQEVRFEKL